LTWGRKRIESIEQAHLSEVESLIGARAACRFFECGRSMLYSWNRKTGKFSLLRARFCDLWFCPLCELRRKLDLKRRVGSATKHLQEEIPSIRWAKLHLTVGNCEVENLRERAR
jgi:plasmid rolling circle replication initiator protein Rep